MSTFNEKIMADLKEAMKAKDQTALSVLRALKSSIKYAAIEKGGADAELDDSEALAVVRKQIKQRNDSIESYDSAGRDDLSSKEKDELAILEKYLPAPPSEEEVSALVDKAVSEVGATSRADMGKVMKLLQELADGRVDGKTLSQEVMKRLG